VTFPAGYDTDKGQDPAEDHIGPFYYRLLDGEYEFAFLAGPEHANANDTLHGGVMMTFADYSLCMVATDGYENESCVTVSFSSEFIAAAEVGQVITCKAEVVRKTGSMVFVRGDVRAGEQILLNFSSVVKRMQPRD
jgi:acyl-coenzyme A thioesterase PaaI-like protein